MIDRRERLEAAVLYLVCGERSDAFLNRALRGGVDMVQLRMKGAEDERILAVAGRFRRRCEEAGALLILNDRPDLAQAADADGVHVGQDDESVAAARSAVGGDRLVGLSTHSPEQIEAAGDVGVDYIGVGPVYSTPTKPGRPAVGLELVQYAAVHATVPFFAIGGVAQDSIAAVARAGAERVAVVRALTAAADPEPVARALRQGIRREETRVGAA